jgi:hypothetical protein
MPPIKQRRRPICRAVLAAATIPILSLTLAPEGASASAPRVLRVGTYNSIAGQYATIQAAVDAAQPGDWVLVGPGVYRERADYEVPTWPAGVWISTPNIHLRGMNRNTVIVDGTKPTASVPCSSAAGDQDLGPSAQGRNGIEVWGPNFTANNVSIENLTVCNFLTSAAGARGNQIWWNGGDGGGHIGLSGYTGGYLTATSTYSSTTKAALGPCCGVEYPSGSYGIFSSDSTHGSWTQDYASNMADSSFYIGACQQRCDAVMKHDHGQNSALCISTTNAGGYLLVENTECDQNKTGPVSNAQNNDDWPSPQLGACDLADPHEPHTGATGTTSCTVWQYNYLHDNNNPDVPGNGTSGLAGGGPVGTGLILAGTRDITLYRNVVTNNKAWGALIADLPDQEAAPSQVPVQCQGGIWLPPPVGVCYYQAVGNVSIDNRFVNNGGYGNPTNGDIGLATLPNNPGNCFSGDRNPVNGAAGSAITDPPGIETLPAYRPHHGLCTTPNGGDVGPLLFEAECASQLLAPCPTAQAALCSLVPSPCPLPPSPPVGANYPRADAKFSLHMPAAQTSMPNPCVNVPANPWCPAPAPAGPGVMRAAAPVAGGIAVGAWALRPRRHRRYAE